MAGIILCCILIMLCFVLPRVGLERSLLSDLSSDWATYRMIALILQIFIIVKTVPLLRRWLKAGEQEVLRFLIGSLGLIALLDIMYFGIEAWATPLPFHIVEFRAYLAGSASLVLVSVALIAGHVIQEMLNSPPSRPLEDELLLD